MLSSGCRNLKTSDNGRHFIEQFEGLYLHSYDDGTGVWTIGYGHTTAAGLPHVHPGMVITKDQSDSILSADLASVEFDVNRLVKVPINQNQFDALVSFHFNTGALARSSLLRAINHGDDHSAIRNDFLMWTHGGGHVMRGLVRRRESEAELYNNVA